MPPNMAGFFFDSMEVFSFAGRQSRHDFTVVIEEPEEDPKNSEIGEFGGRHLFENLTHGCL